MKQARLTHGQMKELDEKGYTFTARHYYWKCYEGNIANRITRTEYMGRSAIDPLQGVEQVRVYARGEK